MTIRHLRAEISSWNLKRNACLEPDELARVEVLGDGGAVLVGVGHDVVVRHSPHALVLSLPLLPSSDSARRGEGGRGLGGS